MAGKDTASESEKQRKARQAAELRANLAKRKGQARARRAGDADERDKGLHTGDSPEKD